MVKKLKTGGNEPGVQGSLLDELRERIVSPEFPAGSILNEKVLAEEFHVSRTPVREALIRLQGEGLVSSSPGRGFFVRDVAFQEFREISEIRWHLSSLVGRLAAERITDDELAELESLYEEIEEGESLESLRQHDIRFHRLTDRATHNQTLMRQKSLLVNQFARIRYSLGPVVTDKYFASLKADVGAFLEGARKRDARACAEALQAHLRRFIEEMLSTD